MGLVEPPEADDVGKAIDRNIAQLRAFLDARDAERARHPDGNAVAREVPPSYNGDGINERFDRLDRALQSLAHQVSNIEREVTGLKGDVSGLKGDVTGLKGDVAGLKGDVAGLKSDVAGLKSDVAGLKSDVAGLKLDVADIRERMATKVELEATNENVRKMADGYETTQLRLKEVAELITRHLVAR